MATFKDMQCHQEVHLLSALTSSSTGKKLSNLPAEVNSYPASNSIQPAAALHASVFLSFQLSDEQPWWDKGVTVFSEVLWAVWIRGRETWGHEYMLLLATAPQVSGARKLSYSNETWVKETSTTCSWVKGDVELYIEHKVFQGFYQGMIILQQHDPYEGEIVDRQVLGKQDWRSEKDGAKSKKGREKKQ